MLSLQNWERRLRRTLKKYGYGLHKVKGKSEYTVDCEGVRWFSSLSKVQGFAEELAYRHAE